MGLLKNVRIWAIGLAILSIFMGHIAEFGLLMPRLLGQVWILLCTAIGIPGYLISKAYFAHPVLAVIIVFGVWLAVNSKSE